MTKGKKKEENKILITDFDGFNVHSPDNSHKYKEFPTFEKAHAFSKIVEDFGWTKATELLEKFKEILV